MPKYEIVGTYQGRRIKPTAIEAADPGEARRKAEMKGVTVESVTPIAPVDPVAVATPPPIPAPPAGGYVGASMVGGEELVRRSRLHWVIFLAVLKPLVPAVIFAALWMGTRDRSTSQTFGILAGVCWAITLSMLVARLVRYFTTELAVTNRRVVMKEGLIRRQSREILIHKVEAIDIEQGIIDRLIGAGTVIVRGTGSTPLKLEGLIGPNRFREAIQSLMA